MKLRKRYLDHAERVGDTVGDDDDPDRRLLKLRIMMACFHEAGVPQDKIDHLRNEAATCRAAIKEATK